MSLSQALATAVSGLRANQAGMAIVSANVANAETPGYARKTISQVATTAGQTGIGVRATAVQRELDFFVQRQLRTETSGAGYADMRARFYERLQNVFGAPGSDGALETIFNNFTNAIQALATSPDDVSARGAVINAGQLLAQHLNEMTRRVQNLRGDAELGIDDAVAKANEAMRQIANLNQQIAAAGRTDNAAATLAEQRDLYIDELAQLMDIKVIEGDFGQVTIFTNSGMQLVGVQASNLAFDPQATMSASTQWSADATERNVGTLTLTSPTGGEIDLIETKAIRSGQIAAFLQLRDIDLVQTQNQLDAIAVALAQSLSDLTTVGTPVTAGPQTGFDIDVGGLLAGNSFDVSYTLAIDGKPRTVTFVRVDDPTALPLTDSDTVNPNDRVFGIDYSGGIASIVAQVNAALAGTGITASNPAGTTLRILDDGAGNIVNVDAASARQTGSSITGGVELPFFLDGGNLYTGAFLGTGAQSTGFAGRINLNGAVVADPSSLVVYQAGIAAGDSTRPSFIYDQLVGTNFQFLPNSGIGAAGNPYSGSISSFLRQVISLQGAAASTAASLKQGQDVVLTALQQRFNDSANVNIDQEMANLLVLQNAYAANARVMSVVKEMFDMLMRS